MMWIVLGAAAIGMIAGFVRSAFRRQRQLEHRPRLLELVEAQEQKLLAPPAEEKAWTPREQVIREWNYPTVRPGHAPSASDLARMVPAMPIPSAGVRRKG